MRSKKGKYLLIALAAILVLGIGYAAISNIGLTISGLSSAKASRTDEDFKVRFVKADSTDNQYIENAENNAILKRGELANGDAMSDSNLTAGVTNDTTATFAINELTTVGDFAEFTYYVVNESEDLNAELSFDVTNVNSQKRYFAITKEVDKSILESGQIATVKVTVKLIEAPKINDVTGNFTITLTAKANEEENAGSNSVRLVESEENISSKADLLSALNDGSTDAKVLYIQNDLDLTSESEIVIDKDTTLSFEGNSVQVAPEALVVEGDAKLVLEDNTGNGGLTSTKNVVTVGSDGELVIKSGSYETTQWSDRGAIVNVPATTENAKVTIDGGTFNGEYFALSSYGDADVVINGGEFTSTATVKNKIGDTTYHAYAMRIDNGTFTMNGGTINGIHGGLALTGTATATINDGIINVANSYEGAKDSFYLFYLEGNASANVLAGTFTNDGTNPAVYTTTTGYIDIHGGTFTAKSTKVFNGDSNGINVRVYDGTFLKKANDNTTTPYDVDAYRQ